MSVLVLIKTAMGVMPELDFVQMLSTMMGFSPGLTWAVNFATGAMWGLVSALAFEVIPVASTVVKGMVLGAGAWLLMMVMVMPMARCGFVRHEDGQDGADYDASAASDFPSRDGSRLRESSAIFCSLCVSFAPREVAGRGKVRT